MTGRPDRGSVDYERLSEYLRALAVPNRLQLLRQLQLPRAVSEITLAPARKARELNEERNLSRQAIEGHLDTLEGLGLVQGRASSREGRSVTEYVVSHARLFLVVEELRRLSLIRSAETGDTAAADRGAGATGAMPAAPTTMPDGAALVLAGGPLEGTAFALEGAGPWTIGREKGNAITLAYDPFVSKANTLVWREGAALRVRTLDGARNGTRVNWRTLAPGETATLRAGDTLGVGRTLLLVRGA